MTYRIDDPKQVIKEIQKVLLDIAHRDERIPKVTASGTYSPLTRQAVTAFQSTQGLPTTGLVDSATWYALYRVWNAMKEEEQTTIFLENQLFDLRLGDVGHGVTVLQSLLGEFSMLYPAVMRPAITGQFGLTTAEAVRAVQRAYGVYADGIVTPILWNRMQRDYRSKREAQKWKSLWPER